MKLKIFKILLCIFIIPLIAVTASGSEKVPRLRNNLSLDSLKRFKATVERQAELFPDTFFLESLSPEKNVALTFDDGPDSVTTPNILEILKKYDVKATFFLVGNKMEKYKDLVREITRDGHAIGGHSYSHPDLRKMTKEKAFEDQIEKTNKVFNNILGYEPAFFRPPYGAVTDEQIIYFGKKGVKIIDWSIDTFDWDPKENSPEKIFEKVSKYKHNGAIVLMHSGGGDRRNTAKALPKIIEYLKNKGYKFLTVPEMLDIPAGLE